MAGPFTGAWVAANGNINDYSGALKWGTGSGLGLHATFGEGPPLLLTGRPDMPGVIAPDNNPHAYETPFPSQLLDPEMFGYTSEDIMQMPEEEYMETDVPPNDYPPEVTRGLTTQYFPPPRLLARPNGPSGNWFRSVTAPTFLQSTVNLHQFPTETVTEGWEHKTAGEVLNAETSSPNQYERQTSLQQVDPPPGRNNAAAVLRGTDDPRNNIRTRLTGMKIKPWSEGQRLADMFPFQQDLMLRPWWFRNAGVGRENWLTANEFAPMDSVQRDPPSQPDTGAHETQGNTGPDFGYTPEDWYG